MCVWKITKYSLRQHSHFSLLDRLISNHSSLVTVYQHFQFYCRASVRKALYRCEYSVVVFDIIVVHKNISFLFEDIDLKLGTLMYYSFIINILRIIFFLKIIFFDWSTFLWKKKFRLSYFSSHSNIFKKLNF